MPTVEFRGREIECEAGDSLRAILVAAGHSPHNGRADALNCRGSGTCGTCAVEVEGETGSHTRREEWRIDFPPHDADSGLRLACQTTVEGDLTVRKYPGFWGQHVDQPALGAESGSEDR